MISLSKTKLFSDPSINSQTIIINEVTVGDLAKLISKNAAGTTYWLDRSFEARSGKTTKEMLLRP